MLNLVATLVALFIVVVDQLVKSWAVANLQNGSVNVIKGVLKLTYVENYGAAFGIFRGQKVLLLVVTGLLLLYCMYLVYTKKLGGTLMTFGAMFAVAGGVGNLIDRATRGFVVDMFDVTDWLNFAVFNVADCFVVGGVILMTIYILFLDGKSRKKDPKGG